jgi:hypothetical protein
MLCRVIHADGMQVDSVGMAIRVLAVALGIVTIVRRNRTPDWSFTLWLQTWSPTSPERVAIAEPVATAVAAFFLIGSIR